MKKAELRKLPTIFPTQTITTLAKRKSTGKNYDGKEYKGIYKYYLRALVINGLIKVSIFNAEWVKTGKKTSQFDIFIDTEDSRYISLEKDKDGKELRWRSSTISYLISYDYWYGREYEHLIWSNIDTDRKIKKALNQSGEAYRAINSYQCGILEAKIKKKEQAECAEYDKDMKQTSPKPVKPEKVKTSKQKPKPKESVPKAPETVIKPEESVQNQAADIMPEPKEEIATSQISEFMSHYRDEILKATELQIHLRNLELAAAHQKCLEIKNWLDRAIRFPYSDIKAELEKNWDKD